jgi:long-chain acyl-CoA synthetase
MGAIGIGAVSVGIYTTSAPAQIEHIVRDTGARVLLVDAARREHALSVREKVPSLKHIVLFAASDYGETDNTDILCWNDLIGLGRVLDADKPGLWEECIAETKPDDLAILIYTSGTTGPPKGAMLSHVNLMFQLEVQQALLPIGPDDELMSFLPLSHIGERLMGDFRPMMSAAAINFVESPEKLAENLREVSPTVFFSVPRVWEKFYAGITGAMAGRSWPARLAYHLALSVGDKVARRQQAGKSIPWPLRALHGIAEERVLRPLRDMIGMGRAHSVLSGAAPIAHEMIRWFFALGLDMRETYGLTETSGVVSFPPLNIRKPGSVGQALPGSEVKIAKDGEILVHGDHIICGYLNMPEESAAAVVDGWLHTGDLGRLDEDGFLTITGRKKDVIITAGGKNVSPSEIENQLKFNPLIADAMVVGDGRKYLTCLIIPNEENVGALAAGAGADADHLDELCRMPLVMDAIQAAIDEVNANFSRAEQIKKFRFMTTPLVPGSDEVTATMKLKRDAMTLKYSDLIEEMYQD